MELDVTEDIRTASSAPSTELTTAARDSATKILSSLTILLRFWREERGCREQDGVRR